MANEIQASTRLNCANSVGYLGSETLTVTKDQTVGKTAMASGTQIATTTDTLLDVTASMVTDVASGWLVEVKNTDASIEVYLNLTSGASTPAVIIFPGMSVLVGTKTHYYIKSASGTPVIHIRACDK